MGGVFISPRLFHCIACGHKFTLRHEERLRAWGDEPGWESDIQINKFGSFIIRNLALINVFDSRRM